MDIVWNGDEVVWCNLFRHYIRSFQMFYSLFVEAASYLPLDHRHVRVSRNRTQPYFDRRGQQTFNKVCKTMFRKSNLDWVARHVSNRPVRRHELLAYLYMIQQPLECEIFNQWQPDAKIDEGKIVHIRQDNPIFALHLGASDDTEDFFHFAYHAKQDSDYVEKMTTMRPSDCFERNLNVLRYDFPSLYLRRLTTLIHPEWYTACFSRSYENGSLWGNYADGHKGVCLVFSTKFANGVEYMNLMERHPEYDSNRLTKPSEKRMQTFRVYDVTYDDQLIEVDFFRNISRIPRSHIEEEWYKAPDGRVSSCGSHLASTRIRDWRSDYWETLTKAVTQKTSDWEFETECRMLLDESLHIYSEPKYRKIQYPFETLQAIIFGINTSEHDKMRIGDVLQKKLNERSHEVKLRQAYVNRNTGRIMFM